jgi:hypothetical protein
MVLVLIAATLVCILEQSSEFGGRQGERVPLDNPTRVAVVFHGSARSFLLPRVHASIKRNLIDALGARVDVFMRLTTQDNVHGKNMGAEGVFITQSQNTAAYLQRALEHVKPTQVTYFNLTDERAEMVKEFEDDQHDLFRTYDHRRYSMYFHRNM